MGRPSIYSEAVASEICDRLVEGESLAAICRSPGMPGHSTVFRWIAQREDFRERYVQTRQMAETFDRDIMSDMVLGVGPRGTESEINSMIQQYRWRAAKRNARKYRPEVLARLAEPEPDLGWLTPEERELLAHISRKVSGGGL